MKKKVIAGVLAVALTFGVMYTPAYINTSVVDGKVNVEINEKPEIKRVYNLTASAEEMDYANNAVYTTVIEDPSMTWSDPSCPGVIFGVTQYFVSTRVQQEGGLVDAVVDNNYTYAVVGMTGGTTVTSVDLTAVDTSKFPKQLVLEDGSVVDLKNAKLDTICDGAFMAGTYLKEINLGNHIKRIGDSAFRGLKYITVIDLPKSVVGYGYNLFEESGIKTVNIHGNIHYIPSGFARNTPLSKISLDHPECLSDIGVNAFENTVLTSFPFDKTADTFNVHPYAFCNCSQLKTVKLPDTTINVGSGAFQNCPVLESASIGKSCLSVGEAPMFIYNEEIPESGHKVGAFENCPSLVSVELNDCLVTLGSYAFKDCTSLVYAPKMPDTLILSPGNIDDGVSEAVADLLRSGWDWDKLENSIELMIETPTMGQFANCTSLKKVELPSTSMWVPSEFCENCTSLTTVVFNKDIVTCIGNRAFKDCTNLQEVAQVKHGHIIGDSAFMNCKALRDIVAVDNDNLLRMAYYGCDSLKKVDVKAGFIGSKSFESCALMTDFTLTADMDFADLIAANCESLVDANLVRDRTYPHLNNCFVKTPFLWGGGQLSGDQVLKTAFVDLKGTNFVPQSIFSGDISLSSLKTTDLNTVEIVMSAAFNDCQSLIEVLMPKVVICEDYAFNGCSNLKKVCPGEITVQDYGNSSFKDCKSLTQKVNAKASTVGTEAFSGSAITDVSINGTVGNTLVIGDRAFSDCTNITDAEIIIPDGVKYEIGKAIFDGCSKLANAEFNGTEISESMFGNCVALTDIKLENAHDVREHGFYNCKMLETIEGVEAFKVIDHEAFTDCKNLKFTYSDANTTYIGDRQYAGCTSLPRADVYSITDEMFTGCTGMTEVALSNDISVIKTRAFADCENLSKINLDKIVEFQEECFRNTGIPSVELKNINSISDAAFSNCRRLHKVVVECEELPHYVFQGCTSLNEVTLGVNSMPGDAFDGCNSIYKLNIISDGAYVLREIPDYTFNSDLLFKVYVPSTVKRIGTHALGYDGENNPVKDFTIYCDAGSAAAAYGEENEFIVKDSKEYDEKEIMAGKIKKGDVDANGLLTVVDAIKMQKWLLNDTVSGCYGPNMDMNDDGVVDIFDLGLLKRELLKGAE